MLAAVARGARRALAAHAVPAVARTTPAAPSFAPVAVPIAQGAGQVRNMATKKPLDERIGAVFDVHQTNPNITLMRFNRMLRDDGELTWPRKTRHEKPAARRYREKKELKRRIERQKIKKLISEAIRMKNMGY